MWNGLIWNWRVVNKSKSGHREEDEEHRWYEKDTCKSFANLEMNVYIVFILYKYIKTIKHAPNNYMNNYNNDLNCKKKYYSFNKYVIQINI